MEGTYEKITKIGIGILLLSFIVLIGYLKINAHITQNDQEKTLTSKKVKQEDLQSKRKMKKPYYQSTTLIIIRAVIN